MSAAAIDLFRNPTLPPEQRIGALIELLTLDEKLALLSTRLGVPRLGVPNIENVEGLHGLVTTGFLGGGAIDIPTTSFPQPYGMAQSWDPELLRQVGAAIGAEARYIAHSPQHGQAKLLVMAPNADLGRDPRWGRTDECYGEDAHLTGALAAALVRGLQGDRPGGWQAAALLKHFLANSNEDGRLASSSDFDERLLHEYYAAPFRTAIAEGGARCLMAAYNAHNGVPCTVQPILRDLAIDDWGLDAIICTDFRGMSNLVDKHQTHPDLAHAAAAAIQAGVSQFLDDYLEPVQAALAQGLLAEPEIDAAIRRNLRVLLRLGLLDPQPGAQWPIGEQAPWEGQPHRALARRAAQAGMVLLKNDGILPLDKSTLQSVAVVGPLADRALTDLYNGRPPYQVSPLAGIAAALGAHTQLLAQRPPARPANEIPPIGMVWEVKPGMYPPIFVPERDIPAAVELARSADLAIVCVGNNPMCGGWSLGHATPSLPSEGMEALDRQSLALEQEALIEAVYAANPNSVVVLISSFPYAIEWAQAHAPAIVHSAHGAQELGNALADVLFGEVNPAGRLVQTWPRSIEQLPAMLDYDIRHGRTYMYFQGQPLYSFGHGLSYTSFGYSNLRLSPDSLRAGEAALIAVDVTNTGARAGDEVVQLYVKHLDSALARPLQELKGFARVGLRPGETKTVELRLAARDLAHWDADAGRLVVEPGAVELRVGRSSAEIELTARMQVAES